MRALLLLALLALPLSAKPNIIYILADDLGYGDLSCYGQKTLATPNLDRLAAEGMRFTNHYAGNTVCSPSRAVLMTGLHSGHLPIRGNGDGPLPDDTLTLPKLLEQAGYHTACIGKWGVGNGVPLDDPAKKGFDDFYGYVDMYHAHNFFPEFLIRNGKKEALPNVLFPKWKEDPRGAGIAEKQSVFAPHRLQEEVLSFLASRKVPRSPWVPAPFFLYYALNIPHANNEGGQMPPRGMEVPLGEDGKPDYGAFSSKDWPDPEKGFAQYITFIDRYVGEILDALDQHDLAKNTLVLFSSDNGPHQEGGHQHDYFDSNGPYRGMKRDLTDGGIRVPFIARWTDTIAPGGTSDHLSGFQDVLPTFCDLADAKIPAGDGLSLFPTLLGRKGQHEHNHLYWEFHRGKDKGQIAILQNTWKLIAPYENGEIQGPGQLFKLNKDPGEQEDVREHFPTKAAALLDLARQSRQPNP